MPRADLLQGNAYVGTVVLQYIVQAASLFVLYISVVFLSNSKQRTFKIVSEQNNQ